MRPKKNIQILNPLSGAGLTSRNRAYRFVKRGLAEWVMAGVSIRFVRNPQDHRERSAKMAARATMNYWYEKASNSGMAGSREMAQTPITAPDLMLGRGRNTGASGSIFRLVQGPV